MKKLIAGNWKMNGTLDDARVLIADILNGLHAQPELLKTCDFLVCPPFLHISAIRHAVYNSKDVVFGAQDCAAAENGAHTGEISAAMLRDSGCSHVILGHSERRQHQGETDALIRKKAERAHAAGLIAIICVGETADERAAGNEKKVVEAQIRGSLPAGASAANTVIAYEPVWAIGTGKTAMPADAEVMHGFIRELLSGQVENPENTRILYGGSMKPDSAKALLAAKNVDGGLIGGASLTAREFLAIAQAA
jgi:triosephosphate isomerase